ncbi:Single-stranded nucleic acid binding R3H domain-containing protein [uncultured delta proteobacterium]|uniref:RNA-binding protein KhpB n=1 Tax=uncultured delta proteobacterium TaxID=34034 RepID=A0A212IWT0_9DELT|nr:Single-stranded nucleic acid binding R3H domain-containing protein [uncultured delta proteobacterium]
MSGYKEFEGKTLDEAIRDACAYYDATRDKLEIDILNDAKGGIFGLVGAKKARVRAKLVELSSVLDGLESLADKGKQQKKKHDAPQGEPRRNGKREARDEAPRKDRSPRPAQPEPAEAAFAEAAFAEATSAPAVEEETAQEAARADDAKRARGRSGGRLARAPRRESPRNEGQRRAKQDQPAKEAESARSNGIHDNDIADIDVDGEEFSRVPFDQLDAAELENAAREIVSRLTAPFLGDVTINVAIGNDRVRVSLNDVEDPGLLIGRDGQTLASLQYLVTRMLSNRMKALLRVQIDAGDYRERQDERLRELALSLAEKVKAGGRPQVTRPLSSYHRRVIHLTLQDDPQIQTHSKGEGEMKRVMVARRKTPA